VIESGAVSRTAQYRGRPAVPRWSAAIKTPYSIYNEDAHRAQILRPGDGRLRVPRGRADNVDASCYHSAGCRARRCTNRWTSAFQATSSRSRKGTATSRCTPCCWARTVHRWRCRSAPRTWTSMAESGDRSALGLQAPRADRPNSAQARAHDWLSSAGSTVRSEHAGSSSGVPRARQGRPIPRRGLLVHAQAETILALPRNATALDFAYAVHTDVGNHAVAARVDKKLAALAHHDWRVGPAASRSSPRNRRYRITAWLEVRGHRARHAPRSATISSTSQHEDAVDLGHRILERALEAQRSSSLDSVPPTVMDRYLSEASKLQAAWRNCSPTSPWAIACRRRGRAGSCWDRGSNRVGGKTQVSPGQRARQHFASLAPSAASSPMPPAARPIPGDDDHGSPQPRARAWWCTGEECTECARVPEVARALGRRSTGIANVEGDYRVELRIEVVNKPGVLAHGGRCRSPKRSRTSTASNTSRTRHQPLPR
jgi:hypothetical protein